MAQGTTVVTRAACTKKSGRMMQRLVTAGVVLASSAVVLAAPRALQVHDDHGGGDCACHAEDFSFTLSCTDYAAISASATTLQGCAVTEAACHEVRADGTEPCQGAYFHLSYVTGACPNATTTAQAALIHTYEDACSTCEVDAASPTDVSQCPIVCEEGEHEHGHRRYARRRMHEHDHDHEEEDPCAHSHWYYWVIGIILLLACVGGGVFAKMKGLGPFADDEKGSSG